jgi:ABC-type lipoprotein export system ATPase subunit
MTHELHFKRLHLSVEGKELLFLEDKNFTSGMILLSGVSGSGKTTFVESVSGRRGVVDCVLSYDGFSYDLREESDSWSSIPSVQFQKFHLLPEMNVMENLTLLQSFGKSMHPDWREFARILAVEELLDAPIGQLSGGEKQRVCLVRALSFCTDGLLLLDEPLVFLDESLVFKAFSLIERLVLENQWLCFFSTHDPRFLEKSCFKQQINFSPSDLRGNES